MADIAKISAKGINLQMRGVTFVTGSAEITPQGQLVLDSLVAGLQRRSGSVKA
jgi:hypothetical protein